MKMVIVVRKDLNMRKGKMIAQGAHAATEQVLKHCVGPEESRQLIQSWWLDHGQRKIVVGVDSEDELIAVKEKALSLGIGTTLITDAGATEFHGVPTRTAVAIGPAEDDKIDQVTGKLRLL